VDPNEETEKKLVFTAQDNLTPTKWMKRDWDQRAKNNSLWFIRSKRGQTEEEFWQSGFINRDQILGVNLPRYSKIFVDKDPKQMIVLEIGCGIGRILIPMTDIFGEAIGLDVSEETISQAKKYIEKVNNCQVFENNGTDLSMFSDNYFDFCYSFIVFQHVPTKEIVTSYIQEVSRVLKPGCLFRFQVFGDTEWKPKYFNTWNGIHFKSDEMHQIAKENNFEILEESGKNDQYYWLTFKLLK